MCLERKHCVGHRSQDRKLLYVVLTRTRKRREREEKEKSSVKKTIKIRIKRKIPALNTHIARPRKTREQKEERKR